MKSPMHSLGLALCTAALGLSLAGCVKEVTLEEKPEATEMQVGEVRTIEMRHWRFDVKKFEMQLDLEALKGMPEKVLRETWMVDLNVRPLIINSLDNLLNLPPDEVDALPQAEYNMWHLLTMTSDTADLRGTSLEYLLEVGEGVGLAPSRILADLVEVGVDEPIIPLEMIADAVIANLIETHPSAQFRRGPVDAEHPDGMYPVTPGTLPVSMFDVVTDFAELPIQFGPATVATEYG
ncbi:MAG: acetyltransferase, partial [Nannocystaceae bacterium]